MSPRDLELVAVDSVMMLMSYLWPEMKSWQTGEPRRENSVPTPWFTWDGGWMSLQEHDPQRTSDQDAILWVLACATEESSSEQWRRQRQEESQSVPSLDWGESRCGIQSTISSNDPAYSTAVDHTQDKIETLKFACSTVDSTAAYALYESGQKSAAPIPVFIGCFPLLMTVALLPSQDVTM